MNICVLIVCWVFLPQMFKDNDTIYIKIILLSFELFKNKIKCNKCRNFEQLYVNENILFETFPNLPISVNIY